MTAKHPCRGGVLWYAKHAPLSTRADREAATVTVGWFATAASSSIPRTHEKALSRDPFVNDDATQDTWR